MSKKITAVLGVLITFLLIGLGGYYIFSSAKSDNDKSVQIIANLVKTKAQPTIAKLKTKPQYKDVDPKTWDSIINDLKSTKSESDFNESYDWTLKQSLDKYEIDNKENLISFKTLQEKINNKEDMVVLFSQPKCPHCIKLKDGGFGNYMQSQIKKGRKIYMVNLAIEKTPWESKLIWDKSKDESSEKSDSTNAGVPGTPAIAHYKDGVMANGLVSESAPVVQTWIEKYLSAN